MKVATLLVSLVVGASAWADVFTPIDVNKQADVNGRAVEMPVVNFDALPQPTRAFPVASQSDRRAEPGKPVEAKTVNFDTLQFSTIETKVIPQANYTAKRAIIKDETIVTERRDSPTAETHRAKINERVIRPVTPEGERELKQQLNPLR